MGGYGVLMFFAISGFLIGGGALEKTRAGDFSFSLYFINRFTRIYIVLLPALLLVWVMDVVGLKSLNGLGIYTQEYPIGALPIGTRDAIGLANFVYNLLMLQNVLGPPFGTAQPLWSLNWEWWSYMIAPFLVGMLVRIGRRLALPLAGGMAAVVVAAGLDYFLLWHIGILLALIRFRHRVVLILAAAICLLVPVVTRAEIIPPNSATQTVFILSFVLLLSQLKHVEFPKWWLRFPHKMFASFSFSTYILHTTVFVFAMACLQTYFSFPRQLQPSGINYGKYVALILVTYSGSYVFALLTESNTGKLRSLIRRFSSRFVSAP